MTALLTAILATVLVCGCGAGRRAGSSAAPTRTSGVRAARPPAPPTPRVSARLRAQERSIHAQISVALRHDHGGRYGALPADLRQHQRAPANQILGSTLAHPADAIQGVTVRLHLGRATALATAVGPDVPTRVQGTFNLHTPATWVITFARVHGRFPLSPRMFSLTDGQGQVLAPRVRTIRGGSLPAFVPQTGRFTVELRSDLFSEGDGKLRYTPVGRRALVEWDFDVETD